MLNVEVVRGNSRIAFQVIQGGIAIAGKRVGGLDALHTVGQLAEFMNAECPRQRFLKTSENYLKQK